MNRITRILALLVALSSAMAAQASTFDELKITEVSLIAPEGVELTNFDDVAVDLTGWVVLWDDGVLHTSQPLSGILQPGQSVVVTETNPAPIPEKPAAVLVLPALPFLSIGTQALSVGLQRPNLTVQDEVHIADVVSGTNSHPGFGSTWRGGVATRGNAFPHASVERIWGLDSNSGRDWTGETKRSLGLENQCAGTRGSEPDPTFDVVMTEIDHYNDYIEIYNKGYTTLSMNDWEFVITSGGVKTIIQPFATNNISLTSGEYYLIGDGPVPSGTALGVFAVNVANFGQSFNLNHREYEIALYDGYGRLMDIVRASGGNDTVVQNHPRAPAHWNDFTGAALRLAVAGDDVICRRISSIGIIGGTTPYFSNGSGADWQPCWYHTLGSVNSGWIGQQGMSDRFDVRAHESALGDGMTIIFNAGSAQAGNKYSFMFSNGHAFGAGPLWGLGWDALTNWLFIQSSPLFSGLLGARGEGRIDLPPGALPPGVTADVIFLLQDPGTGAVLMRTPIIMFDT